MNTTRWTRISAVAAAGALAVSMAACSNDASGTTAKSSAPSPDSTMSTQAMAGQTFGTACAMVPTDPTNAGSFEAMAQAPVATAASGNPLLSTLVTAVKKAGLVNTLNGLDSATVFAPTNDAFAKIPKATLDKVLADKATLTKILTYHVIAGPQLSPENLTTSPLKSVESETVKVTGSGTDYTVNDSAKVLCGNVQTSNARVYIIDSVLMPPAMMKK